MKLSRSFENGDTDGSFQVDLNRASVNGSINNGTVMTATQPHNTSGLFRTFDVSYATCQDLSEDLLITSPTHFMYVALFITTPCF